MLSVAWSSFDGCWGWILNTESLGQDLAALFDEGAPAVTLEEVQQRTLNQSARQVQPKRQLLIAAAAFGVIVLGGILIGLLTQPSEPDPAVVSTPELVNTTTTISSTTTLPDPVPTTLPAPSVLPGSLTALPSEGFPLEAREDSSAVWTGTEMIVWGGWPTDAADAGGAAYDPSTGTWRSLPAAPIDQAYGHEAVWTGSEVIIWGGNTTRGFTNQGAVYNPATDTWRTIAESPLAPRQAHSAVWTGSEMIIVGGYGPTPEALTTVAAYNPDEDSWRTLAEAPILGGLVEFGEGQTAIWTGSHVLVYGADELALFGEATPAAIAASYDPTDDSWTTLTDPLIHPRLWHSAIWTGAEMIIWGGSGREEAGPAGVSYQPEIDTWRALKDAPVNERARHSAIWTGTHMIIWGGTPIRPVDTTERIGAGIAYNPETEQWLTTDTPTVQSRTVTTLWTGQEVIIWTGDPSQSGGYSIP